MVLSFIRELDLYKKVPRDLKQGTLVGAFISVVCVFVTVYLIVSELILYSNGTLKTSMFVANSQQGHLSLRFNITVYGRNCSELSVDLRDSRGKTTDHNLEIEKEQDDENCVLTGDLELPKTPGVMLIVNKQKNWYKYKLVPDGTKEGLKAMSMNDSWSRPMGYVPPPGYKLIRNRKNTSLNHRINRMEFGGEMEPRLGWEDVMPNKLVPFKHLNGVERRIPFEVSHDYHLKLVPTSFIDQFHSRVDTFQYTYAYQSMLMILPKGVAPSTILMRYEISALEIQYKYTRKPLYHLLTMICAIVGGIFTFANIIDKFFFTVHQAIRHKIEIGKQS